MSKRKAGVPDGFKFEVDKPIRAGDYLDEIDVPPSKRSIPKPVVAPQPVTPKPIEAPNGAVVDAPSEAPETETRARGEQRKPKRARLNVSMEGQKRLSALVSRMRRLGPEPTLAASEILEGLILAAYDAQEHLDLSNVRQRGKYGSPSHKNFPVAIAESLTRAIKEAP